MTLIGTRQEDTAGQAVTSRAAACPVCGSGQVVEFLDIPDIPVYCNVLWSSRREALDAPLGDMTLGWCKACSHVFNTAFDPALITYDSDYENSLHFSARFRSYAESQVAHLIDRYDLRDKVVLEIGCGQGEFLRLICERGENSGIGMDPSIGGPRGERVTAGRITLINDGFSRAYFDLAVDLVCCRQVLEHLSVPAELLNTVRDAVTERPETAIFFEVPNGLFTLRDKGIWDLIYEHVSYFTPASLAYAFAQAGFEVRDLREAYGGQYLCLEAVGSSEVDSDYARGQDRDGVADLVADFAEDYQRMKREWCDRLESLDRKGRKAVVWGAGSKGVSFLNALRADHVVAGIVDISPRKQGMHVAGTGHQVIAPEALAEIAPDSVIVMNPLYKDEVIKTVRQIGIEAEVVCM